MSILEQKRSREILTVTMKAAIILAGAAASFMAAPAFAGPYVNLETNAGYTGSEYNSAVTDFHIGYEGALGESAGYYVQGGPSIVAVDGADTTNELSGKAGVGVDVAENVNVYGEIAFTTVDEQDDLDYGLKAGVKFSF